MPKKITRWNRPSIATQIAAGVGTPEQIKAIYAEMKQDGASTKTLKRMREAAMVHSVTLDE